MVAFLRFLDALNVGTFIQSPFSQREIPLRLSQTCLRAPICRSINLVSVGCCFIGKILFEEVVLTVSRKHWRRPLLYQICLERGTIAQRYYPWVGPFTWVISRMHSLFGCPLWLVSFLPRTSFPMSFKICAFQRIYSLSNPSCLASTDVRSWIAEGL